MDYAGQRTVNIGRAQTADKGTDEAGAKLVGKGDAKADGYDEHEATAHTRVTMTLTAMAMYIAIHVKRWVMAGITPSR